MKSPKVLFLLSTPFSSPTPPLRVKNQDLTLKCFHTENMSFIPDQYKLFYTISYIEMTLKCMRSQCLGQRKSLTMQLISRPVSRIELYTKFVLSLWNEGPKIPAKVLLSRIIFNVLQITSSAIPGVWAFRRPFCKASLWC